MTQRTWPILLLLVAAVLIPTAGVLWFMGIAVRNERLTVRHKLQETYQAQLSEAADHLDRIWADRAAALADAAAGRSAAECFAELVRSGQCDSAVVRDTDGADCYPSVCPTTATAERAVAYEWRRAHRLEFENADPAAAAETYAAIAAATDDANTAARALQARARCLVKAGGKPEALDLLTSVAGNETYADARDEQGRLIVPNLHLLLLQLSADPDDARYRDSAEALTRRVSDYGPPLLTSQQRVFLMRRLQEVVGGPPLPMLDAEELAAEYLATNPEAAPPDELSPTALPGVWRLASTDCGVTALYGEERLLAEAGDLLAKEIATADVLPLLPDGGPPTEEPFITIPARGRLPGWRLALYLKGEDPFAEAAARQTTVYVWTGLIVVGAVALVALIVGRYVLVQIKLTALKNSFVATVTHELKTPLASMRVLVDTLLDGRQHDERQVGEYLQLVARENARLSRLIDNFLTFSRMERGKVAFELVPIHLHAVINEAAETFRERCSSCECRFDVDVEEDLPPIVGDPDALLTVVLNLLDNAYKYSGESKRIGLRAYANGEDVRVEVTDTGVGIPRRALRKVFDRFYQVDRSLSRGVGGCGLGLSIVRFIVDAHGGTVTVRSRPGEGTTFTVTLPVDFAATVHQTIE